MLNLCSTFAQPFATRLGPAGASLAAGVAQPLLNLLPGAWAQLAPAWLQELLNLCPTFAQPLLNLCPTFCQALGPSWRQLVCSSCVRSVGECVAGMCCDPRRVSFILRLSIAAHSCNADSNIRLASACKCVGLSRAQFWCMCARSICQGLQSADGFAYFGARGFRVSSGLGVSVCARGRVRSARPGSDSAGVGS